MKLEIGKTYKNNRGREFTIDYFDVMDGVIQAYDNQDSMVWLGDGEGWEEVKPENKWLKTGWVSLKADPKNKRAILGYKEGEEYPPYAYFLRGAYYSEEEMEETFTPCESPIGQ